MKRIDNTVIFKMVGPDMYRMLMNAQHEKERREVEEKERALASIEKRANEEIAKQKDAAWAAANASPREQVRQRTFDRQDELRNRYRRQDLAFRIYEKTDLDNKTTEEMREIAQNCFVAAGQFLIVEKKYNV